MVSSPARSVRNWVRHRKDSSTGQHAGSIRSISTASLLVGIQSRRAQLSTLFPADGETLMNQHINTATAANTACVNFLHSVKEVIAALHRAKETKRYRYLGFFSTKLRISLHAHLKELKIVLGRLRLTVDEVVYGVGWVQQEDEKVRLLCEEGAKSLVAELKECERAWKSAWKLWKDMVTKDIEKQGNGSLLACYGGLEFSFD